uniref:Protein ECERIFERUM 1-like n=2 Tax=Nicotiana TaxID=4085 RepID=A0A1S4DLE1_TOBAC|nr:PREDICTED: protein ECERIFERUM 1-like [Nicotiana sylvestris]XP_016514220.1 PREDICTED: protein ECERIFERUM 1-like [Nicotiana tabacum]
MASLLLLCFILVLSSFSIIGFTELCTTIFSTLVIIRITTPPLLLSPSCVLDLRSHICCREKFIQESQITNLAIPKCRIQYLMKSRRETINNLMEEAIIEADQKGIQVLSLGLLNQASQSICLKNLMISQNLCKLSQNCYYGEKDLKKINLSLDIKGCRLNQNEQLILLVLYKFNFSRKRS